jgi:hypothetical protein
VEHRLAQLVLGAMLLAILLAVTGELQAGSLEDIVEATTPKGAPISIDGVVGGLADEAEGREVFVRVKEGADVLVELWKVSKWKTGKPEALALCFG